LRGSVWRTWTESFRVEEREVSDRERVLRRVGVVVVREEDMMTRTREGRMGGKRRKERQAHQFQVDRNPSSSQCAIAGEANLLNSLDRGSNEPLESEEERWWAKGGSDGRKKEHIETS